MARIRTIKPEFWGDPKTCRVSRDARLLFLGLLNESDDQGRQLGAPKRIVGAIFPHDKDVNEAKIKRWLDELETVGFVQRYRVDDVDYLLIVGFTKHQRVSHPTESRLPPAALPNGSGEAPEPLRPDLGRGIDLGTDLGTGRAPPPWKGSGEGPMDFVQKLKNKTKHEPFKDSA